MRILVVAAFAQSACGEVAVTIDASIDAYEPDAGPVCQEGEMFCNNTCANVQSSDLYCGNCTTQCNLLEGCLSGTCRRRNSTCADIRAFDPAAPNDVYFNGNTGHDMYCDFTNNMTYDDIVINPFTTPPPGYVVARVPEFSDPGFQAAWLGLYNKNQGHRAYSSYTVGNSCVTTVAATRLYIGGINLRTGQGTAVYEGFSPNGFVQGSYYTAARSGGPWTLTLPGNWFVTYPPTEVAGCSDSGNTAYWYKRHAGLN